MKIEVLFPELCNIYGDMANVRYLAACAKDAQIQYTGNLDTPLFVTERVDMIYIGCMPEGKHAFAISRLAPYADRLRELIDDGVVVLATGNAVELFGQYILDGEEKIPALGLYSYHAERDFEHRHNSMFLGKFGDMEIVGTKSQFSFCYGTFKNPFITVTGGFGMNPEEKTEGVHDHNFFGTYLLGPFLVLNPLFTKYLLRLLHSEDTLAFESQAIEAYNYRLAQLKRPGVRFVMGEHG